MVVGAQDSDKLVLFVYKKLTTYLFGLHILGGLGRIHISQEYSNSFVNEHYLETSLFVYGYHMDHVYILNSTVQV